MQTQNSPKTSSNLLALDVGDARIGVAIADSIARLPHPLVTLQHTSDIVNDIEKLVTEHHASALVIGLPRGLDGQRTAQTDHVEAFAATLTTLTVPIHWQDEAVTSKQAEAELRSRGKPYQKGDIDALAATYILEDFLRDNPEN